jgi:hypothetical protein
VGIDLWLLQKKERFSPTSICNFCSNFKEQVVLDVALDGHVGVRVGRGHPWTRPGREEDWEGWPTALGDFKCKVNAKEQHAAGTERLCAKQGRMMGREI